MKSPLETPLGPRRLSTFGWLHWGRRALDWLASAQAAMHLLRYKTSRLGSGLDVAMATRAHRPFRPGGLVATRRSDIADAAHLASISKAAIGISALCGPTPGTADSGPARLIPPKPPTQTRTTTPRFGTSLPRHGRCQRRLQPTGATPRRGGGRYRARARRGIGPCAGLHPCGTCPARRAMAPPGPVVSGIWQHFLSSIGFPRRGEDALGRGQPPNALCRFYGVVHDEFGHHDLTCSRNTTSRPNEGRDAICRFARRAGLETVLERITPWPSR